LGSIIFFSSHWTGGKAGVVKSAVEGGQFSSIKRVLAKKDLILIIDLGTKKSGNM